jgi:septum formation protein
MTPSIRPEFILASSSPRRHALLRLLELSFTVLKPPDDEARRPGEAPRAYALRVARQKARWASAQPAVQRRNRPVIIAADTIVCLGARVLGKPRHDRDAAAMLRALSGRTHEVITAVCVRGRRRAGAWTEHVRAVRTRVRFNTLTRRDILRYVRSGEPRGKAGAYAVQGRAAFMVRSLRGSYTNVVGLPLAELHDLLTLHLNGRPGAGTGPAR